ncbi:UMP-CMP kinase-like [Amphiura filiformis]|uniref:UMP-CMP kinase-like n=1 Tax=Amphiura filiformis TaxID=82378 RepID=UPI003B226FC4
MLKVLGQAFVTKAVRTLSQEAITMATKPAVIFVLGAPGAGKGTQCERIVQKFGFVHLSAGDLLREERNSGSKDGNLIQDYIKEGKIVPVEITVNLLDKAMEKSQTKKFLIDGFPRNEDNLSGWNTKMAEKTDFKFVLFFECSEQECVDRVLKRGQSSGRTDDNMESLKKRFTTYVEQTKPIVDHYAKDNKVRTIHADRGVDEVFTDVSKLFQDESL